MNDRDAQLLRTILAKHGLTKVLWELHRYTVSRTHRVSDKNNVMRQSLKTVAQLSGYSEHEFTEAAARAVGFITRPSSIRERYSSHDTHSQREA